MGIFQLFSRKKAEPVPIITPPKILVVDDEQYLRDFYQELLSGEGYTVITAANGQEALMLANEQKPDLILLDLMMPVMDGNEVMKKLHENPQTANISIIVMTNAGTIDNMDHARDFSVKQFFIKSNVSPTEILNTVKQIISFPSKT